MTISATLDSVTGALVPYQAGERRQSAQQFGHALGTLPLVPLEIISKHLDLGDVASMLRLNKHVNASLGGFDSAMWKRVSILRLAARHLSADLKNASSHWRPAPEAAAALAKRLSAESLPDHQARQALEKGMAANLSEWVAGLRLHEHGQVRTRFDAMSAKAGHWLDWPSELEAVKHIPLYALAGELAAHGRLDNGFFDKLLAISDSKGSRDESISLHDLFNSLDLFRSGLTDAEKRSALDAFLKQTDDRPPLSRGVALVGLTCLLRDSLSPVATSPGELTTTDLFDAILTKLNGLPDRYAGPVRQALREPLHRLYQPDQDRRPDASSLTRREAVFGPRPVHVAHALAAAAMVPALFLAAALGQGGSGGAGPNPVVDPFELFELMHRLARP